MTAVTTETTTDDLVKQMREAWDNGLNDALAGRGYGYCCGPDDDDVRLAYGFGWKKGYDMIQAAQQDAA
jgi:hypothetical protein